MTECVFVFLYAMQCAAALQLKHIVIFVFVCLPGLLYVVQIQQFFHYLPPATATVFYIVYASKLRCPAPGKGKTQKEWDFAKVRKFKSAGTRDESKTSKKPMCHDDFVEYRQSKECPSYLRLFSYELNQISLFVCRLI